MWKIVLYILISAVCGYYGVKKFFPFNLIIRRKKRKNNYCEIPPEVCFGKDLSDCESCTLKPECKEYLKKKNNNF
jgi:hypothetical protein